MILRFFFKFVRLIIIAIIVLVLLTCIFYAVLQTKWAKEQIREKVVSALNEIGITVSAEELNGQPPFSWTLQSADVSLSKNQELRLKQIKMRIAIFPLLRGKIAINYLKIENAEYSFFFTPQTANPFSLTDAKALLIQQIKETTLPCQIAIHHLAIDNLTLINRENNSSISFGVAGKALMRKDKREFAFDLHLLSPDHETTYLEAELVGSEPKNFIETKFKVHLDALPLFLVDDITGKIAANFSLRGPWTTWNEILYDLPRTSQPLSGNISCVLADMKVPNFSILDRKWKFKAQFSIPSSTQIYCKQFMLLSDLVQVRGKGQLMDEIEMSQGMLTFSLPDLSLLSSQFPLELAGNAYGKALYNEGSFKASFETADLKLDSFSAMTTRGLIKGSREGEEWEGEVKLSSDNAQIPFENSFAFEYIPDAQFSIIDFALQIPDGNANGYLTYDIPHHLLDSSLFANILHLDRFATLLKEDNLDGNFAIELQFSSNDQQQDAKGVVLGSNMRFRDLLLDDLTISAEILNLFDHPQGRFSLLAEKFYSPNIYLTRLNFGTSSDEESWPFFLDAEGRLENPFQCYAKGFWKKENPLFTLELTQLFGDLAMTPFALKYPAELEWSTDYLNLSPFDFRIGEGHLYTSFELSPVRSLAKWDLTHFPLEVLSCLKPRFLLKGFVTSNGFFDADAENFEGTFNAVLEEANVLHFGKKEPFRAKGSLQAHINHQMAQIHTDLRTIDEQFLDFNASLPIEYNLYPFRIGFDETKHTSAELIAEGKLEDLFDFVNLGSNSFTGLFSCRLFLSQTLAAPSLQGELDWQHGTFANYFTGISLKDINAQFEAKNDTVQLIHFTAVDEGEGNVTAVGKILLKPKERFPYAIDAEMTHLHALGFDMIDCNLTGPLYLTGDTHNMFAQGNLLIDEAKITITERLPYEVPSLPVTYINRPSHLQSKTIVNEPRFAFHMDLELTAEDKVFVEGSGLKGELQGNVHLYGTNTNVAANGSLKLIKGEYSILRKNL